MRWRCERGQTAAEYVGLLLVVSVIVAAVASSHAGAAIRDALSTQVCKIANGADAGCGRPARAEHHRAPHRSRPAGTAVAHAANIPCDGMTPRECTALRGMINRAQAEHQQAREAYLRYAAEFAAWVAGAEGIANVTDVVYRPGLFKAINALLRKKVNREGARLLTSITNKPLSHLVKSNYRYGAKIGKGSTADALRDEALEHLRLWLLDLRGDAEVRARAWEAVEALAPATDPLLLNALMVGLLEGSWPRRDRNLMGPRTRALYDEMMTPD